MPVGSESGFIKTNGSDRFDPTKKNDPYYMPSEAQHCEFSKKIYIDGDRNINMQYTT